MDEKQHGKLGTFFFWGIPLLFTAILAVIIINFLGIPVGQTFQDWGNKVPVLNQIIPDSTSVSTQVKKSDDLVDWKQKYLQRDSELKAKDQQISDLNKQLSSNQNGLDDLTKSNEQLQKQLENKQNKAVQNQLKQVAGIYANMPKSKAAAILESMSLEDSSLTMSVLDQKQQSNILGSMKDVKKAAQITMLIKEISMLQKTDQTELKNQIHEIALQQENPAQTLAETIAGMPPAQSAGIIQTMMGTNSQVAMDLMKNVSTNSRSQILTEIAKADAKLAAQITASLN